MSEQSFTIQHNPGESRFSTVVDGHPAELDYRRHEGYMAIEHTIVPGAIGGRGIAGALVRAALEYARAQGLKVVPACSYAAQFIQRHPEYADLVR
ncbi:MAG: GNAT family N-acetyltransferase [Pseudoxanthomonas sp.]